MSRLAARPIGRVAVPAYPTKLDVLAEPELLARHVPPAWLAKAEVAGALSAFLAVNAVGCADKTVATGARTDPRLATAAIVAPIFEHGKGQGPGRGAMGCIAVAAPVFLSEEEALVVIRDELGKYDLDVSQRGVVLDSVIIDGHRPADRCDWLTDQHRRDMVAVREPLETDLTDPQRKVAVEYVAEADFGPLGGDDCDSDGGDDFGQWAMDLKGVAQAVAAQVRNKGKGVYFGAFYDPVRYSSFGYWGERGDLAASPAEAKAQAQELLRAQVKDFADWLKGQGVI